MKKPGRHSAWFGNLPSHDKLLVAIKAIEDVGDVVDRLESAAEAEFHHWVR